MRAFSFVLARLFVATTWLVAAFGLGYLHWNAYLSDLANVEKIRQAATIAMNTGATGSIVTQNAGWGMTQGTGVMLGFWLAIGALALGTDIVLTLMAKVDRQA